MRRTSSMTHPPPPIPTPTPRWRLPHPHHHPLLVLLVSITTTATILLLAKNHDLFAALAATTAPVLIPVPPARSMTLLTSSFASSRTGGRVSGIILDAGGSMGGRGESSPIVCFFIAGGHRRPPPRTTYTSILRRPRSLLRIASLSSSHRNPPNPPRWLWDSSSDRPSAGGGVIGPLLTPLAGGILDDQPSEDDGVSPPPPALDDDSDEFRPKFDGQLYYGLPSDERGEVSTTLADLRAKVGMDELETIGLGGGMSVGGVEDDAGDEKLLIASRGGADVANLEKPGGPDDDDSIAPYCHERLIIHPREHVQIRDVPCISRTVPITPNMDITVYEMERPSELVQRWMENHDDPSRKNDPFGVVMWPGSIQASRELIRMRRTVANSTVLVLGAGSGVEVQVAARLGARRVLATDVNTFTLELVRYGMEKAGYANVVETMVFDVTDRERALPLLEEGEVDVVVASDVLYNERLADAVGMRCREILDCSGPRRRRPALIVTDSQRFHGTDFLRKLNLERAGSGSAEALWEWKEVTLGNVTGSGILIEGDQTYDVKVRMLSLDGGSSVVEDVGD